MHCFFIETHKYGIAISDYSFAIPFNGVDLILSTEK